jgi:hypothetical protein
MPENQNLNLTSDLDKLFLLSGKRAKLVEKELPPITKKSIVALEKRIKKLEDIVQYMTKNMSRKIQFEVNRKMQQQRNDNYEGLVDPNP